LATRKSEGEEERRRKGRKRTREERREEEQPHAGDSPEQHAGDELKPRRPAGVGGTPQAFFFLKPWRSPSSRYPSLTNPSPSCYYWRSPMTW